MKKIWSVSLLWLQACGAPEEPSRVELPVVVDASAIASTTTDVGYEVELTEARLVVENIVFSTAGEAHARSPFQRVADFLVPAAHAHAGHFQGGDVTGELRGRFVLSWLPSAERKLGSAILLVGAYESASFTFSVAGADDEVDADDPLFGHTALLRGRASRNAQTIEFVAVIDSPAGRELVGVPFELDVEVTSHEELGLQLLTTDRYEGDSLFDGIDFAALDADGDGKVAIDPSGAPTAYNVLRRTFQTHDHFHMQASLPAN